MRGESITSCSVACVERNDGGVLVAKVDVRSIVQQKKNAEEVVLDGSPERETVTKEYLLP
jgi:hypothetical protein